MDPLIFEPYLRPQVWGGRRLAELHKRLPDDATYGESWEISSHPLHVSTVCEGEFAGKSLNELWMGMPQQICGELPPSSGRFPLLFKYLEAKELLSVQVHPTDELARSLIGNESGKTEAWIILAAEPTGRIFAGLKPGVDRELFSRRMDDGTVVEYLHSFHPQPGDCIFLPAGTVHAVGGGVLFAEVQQTSDATFRLFDWNRPGTDGKPRQLHKEAGLKSIDWSRGPVQPVQGRPVPDLSSGIRGTSLVQCEYFEMTSFQVDRQLSLSSTRGFQVWMVLAGEAELRRPQSGYVHLFERGETVLIPAACGEILWENKSEGGCASLLHVTVPKSG